MIDLAMRGRMGPVNLLGIAQRQKISLSYLEQLFGRLRRHELVESARGPGGGYTLARSAHDITVAAIILAVDDPLDCTQCLGNQDCSDGCQCPAHELWSDLSRQVFDYLDSVTLAELVQQQRAKRPETAARQISVLREHHAALALPTSTLQPLRIDGTRLPISI